jgi:hypothetical protein
MLWTDLQLDDSLKDSFFSFFAGIKTFHKMKLLTIDTRFGLIIEYIEC